MENNTNYLILILFLVLLFCIFVCLCLKKKKKEGFQTTENGETTDNTTNQQVDEIEILNSEPKQDELEIKEIIMLPQDDINNIKPTYIGLFNKGSSSYLYTSNDLNTNNWGGGFKQTKFLTSISLTSTGELLGIDNNGLIYIKKKTPYLNEYLSYKNIEKEVDDDEEQANLEVEPEMIQGWDIWDNNPEYTVKFITLFEYKKKIGDNDIYLVIDTENSLFLYKNSTESTKIKYSIDDSQNDKLIKIHRDANNYLLGLFESGKLRISVDDIDNLYNNDNNPNKEKTFN